jgi:uncharacterized membrane protein YbhN (UPF0104 family)
MTWRRIFPLLSIVAALIGLYAFWRVLQRYDFAELWRSISELPPRAILLALAQVAGAYIAIAAGEYLGVLYAGRRLPAWRVFTVTVAALGIGHSIGIAALSSGAVRLRMYGRSGIKPVETGKVVLFSAVTVAIGLTGLIAVATLVRSDEIAALLGLPQAVATVAAVVALALLAAYFAACVLVRRPLRIRREQFTLPDWRLAAGQLVLGPLQPLLVGTILFTCLQPLAEISWGDTISLYAGADAAAVLGHVPGGWGVLEYVFTRYADGPGIIAGVLVFRGVYYLLMLLIGAAILVLDEVWRRAPEATLSSRPA